MNEYRKSDEKIVEQLTPDDQEALRMGRNMILDEREKASRRCEECDHTKHEGCRCNEPLEYDILSDDDLCKCGKEQGDDMREMGSEIQRYRDDNNDLRKRSDEVNVNDKQIEWIIKHATKQFGFGHYGYGRIVGYTNYYPTHVMVENLDPKGFYNDWLKKNDKDHTWLVDKNTIGHVLIVCASELFPRV